MSSRIDTRLAKDALQMAIGRRVPSAGLIHHTDRGSQYASHAYQGLLKENGMTCSMSGKGECGLDHDIKRWYPGLDIKAQEMPIAA